MMTSSASYGTHNVETCPSWCIADHGSQDHPDNPAHHSEVQLIPAVELVSYSSGGELHFMPMTLELEVALEQRVDATETFVYFGVGEERARSFRLSLESTKRLVDALHEALRAAETCSRE